MSEVGGEDGNKAKKGEYICMYRSSPNLTLGGLLDEEHGHERRRRRVSKAFLADLLGVHVGLVHQRNALQYP